MRTHKPATIGIAVQAGAYTRPLLSSTSADSDTLIHPERPLMPTMTPNQPSNNLHAHPLSHTNCLR